MTVDLNVKRCMVSLKDVKETLSTIAQKSEDETAKRIFHESMKKVEEIILDLQRMIVQQELEKPQFKRK
jgi:bacterioferritin (cytochrome b1)